ncbi:hypothetical protein ACWC2H_21190 [Streptomyces sp. 900105755]
MPTRYDSAPLDEHEHEEGDLAEDDEHPATTPVMVRPTPTSARSRPTDGSGRWHIHLGPGPRTQAQLVHEQEPPHRRAAATGASLDGGEGPAAHEQHHGSGAAPSATGPSPHGLVRDGEQHTQPGAHTFGLHDELHVRLGPADPERAGPATTGP